MRWLRTMKVLGLLLLAGCAGADRGALRQGPSTRSNGTFGQAASWPGDPYAPRAGSVEGAGPVTSVGPDTPGYGQPLGPDRPGLALRRPDPAGVHGSASLAYEAWRNRHRSPERDSEVVLSTLPVALTVQAPPATSSTPSPSLVVSRDDREEEPRPRPAPSTLGPRAESRDEAARLVRADSESESLDRFGWPRMDSEPLPEPVEAMHEPEEAKPTPSPSQPSRERAEALPGPEEAETSGEPVKPTEEIATEKLASCELVNDEPVTQAEASPEPVEEQVLSAEEVKPTPVPAGRPRLTSIPRRSTSPSRTTRPVSLPAQILPGDIFPATYRATDQAKAKTADKAVTVSSAEPAAQPRRAWRPRLFGRWRDRGGDSAHGKAGDLAQGR